MSRLTLATGLPHTGAWCNAHALSHLAHVEVHAFDPSGVTSGIGTWYWCDWGEA